MRKNWLIPAAGAAILTTGAAFLTAAWRLYRMGFATGEKERAEPDIPPTCCQAGYLDQIQPAFDRLRALPCEQVHITAPDGTLLAGRYYHQADGAPAVLFFHGWRSSAFRDGCAAFWLCRSLGYNILLADQRGHGGSGGKCLTMGVRERDDCAAWAHWAAGRMPGVPLALMGVSMGAATVMMAADRNLPDEVKGIIADCGYTAPREILRKCMPEMLPRLPVWFGYSLGWLGAVVFGRFDPNAADARTALAACQVPVLLIHGEADDFVPCRMSRENYDACTAPKRLATFPGAIHAVCCYEDPERYRQEVSSFLAGCFSGNIPSSLQADDAGGNAFRAAE